jgi:hypothetical protein
LNEKIGHYKNQINDKKIFVEKLFKYRIFILRTPGKGNKIDLNIYKE